MIFFKKMIGIFFCILAHDSFLIGMEAVSKGPRIPSRAISSILVSPNNQYRAISYEGGFLNVVKSLPTEDIVYTANGANGVVAFSQNYPDGTLLASARNDGSIFILNLDKNSWRTIPANKSPIHAVSFHSDGIHFAYALPNKIYIFDLQWEKVIKTVDFEGQSNIVALQYSPDGKDIAVGFADGSARAFDAQMDNQWWSIEGDGSCSSFISWSTNSNQLAVGSGRCIFVYEKETGGRFESFKVLQAGVLNIKAIAWHPNGSMIVTVADGVARLWDMQTLCCLRNLSRGLYVASAAAFSPDGATLIMNCAPRLTSTQKITDILKLARCFYCGRESDILMEKEKFGDSSKLICPNCKASGIL